MNRYYVTRKEIHYCRYIVYANNETEIIADQDILEYDYLDTIQDEDAGIIKIELKKKITVAQTAK